MSELLGRYSAGGSLHSLQFRKILTEPPLPHGIVVVLPVWHAALRLKGDPYWPGPGQFTVTLPFVMQYSCKGWQPG